jgi:Tfp pilus assembly protein PilE
MAVSPRRQQGMTMISVALLVVMIGFLALIGLRLFPVYIENYKVGSHLKQLAQEPDTKDMSDDEILKTLAKRFQIDDVNNVKNEHIFIEHNGDSTTIAVEYEVRTPAVGNVDMVVSFVDEVTVN